MTGQKLMLHTAKVKRDARAISALSSVMHVRCLPSHTTPSSRSFSFSIVLVMTGLELGNVLGAGPSSESDSKGAMSAEDPGGPSETLDFFFLFFWTVSFGLEVKGAVCSGWTDCDTMEPEVCAGFGADLGGGFGADVVVVEVVNIFVLFSLESCTCPFLVLL